MDIGSVPILQILGQAETNCGTSNRFRFRGSGFVAEAVAAARGLCSPTGNPILPWTHVFGLLESLRVQARTSGANSKKISHR